MAILTYVTLIKGKKAFDRHNTLFHDYKNEAENKTSSTRRVSVSNSEPKSNISTPKWNPSKGLYQCFICTLTSKYAHNVLRHVHLAHQKTATIGDLKKIEVTEETLIPKSKKTGPRSKIPGYSVKILNDNEKIYYVLPRPKKGKWIVILENIDA